MYNVQNVQCTFCIISIQFYCTVALFWITALVNCRPLCGLVVYRVGVGQRISDREVASSIPGCSAARCNSGQVVHTRVPLFTKQYKLVPS